MILRLSLVASVVGILSYLAGDSADACCTAPSGGVPVVNADQTVIVIWDADNKTQHFIRKASFKTEADDFGFLVPSPTQPELDEAGNDAFPLLQKLTEPATITRLRFPGIGCSAQPADALAWSHAGVTVLEEKLVAGFHATVLEAKSATALAQWLKEHDYAFSPEVEAWAKPYVEAGWKITALKVAKNKEDVDKKTVTASSLRISFKTERPVFPYREPDSKSAAEKLDAKRRLLRIYFLAEARYQGELTKESPWTGKVVWAGKLKNTDRAKLLEHLKLPATTGPAEYWLTEFEDQWPYKVAPADVYFSRSPSQASLKRDPIIQYTTSKLPMDLTVYALAAVALTLSLVPRLRRSLP